MFIHTSTTRYTLSTTCTKLYTISVFFSSNGLRFFMYCGPAYRQKYKYVTRIVSSGPGELASSHGLVRGSVRSRRQNKVNQWREYSMALTLGVWQLYADVRSEVAEIIVTNDTIKHTCARARARRHTFKCTRPIVTDGPAAAMAHAVCVTLNLVPRNIAVNCVYLHFRRKS